MLCTDVVERMLLVCDSSPSGEGGKHISAGEQTLTQHQHSPLCESLSNHSSFTLVSVIPPLYLLCLIYQWGSPFFSGEFPVIHVVSVLPRNNDWRKKFLSLFWLQWWPRFLCAVLQPSFFRVKLSFIGNQ